MIDLDVQGAAPAAADPYHVTARLHGVPRVGDQLSVWTGRSEVYLRVGEVTWPTWRYAHDSSQLPGVWLERPAEMSDDEWSDVFAAIGEGRAP